MRVQVRACAGREGIRGISTLSREDEDFPVVMRSMSISPVRGSVAADCVATCHTVRRACVRACYFVCVCMRARARADVRFRPAKLP